MKVSIIICTLNNYAGLNNVLNLLHSQKLKPYEIIIVHGEDNDSVYQVVKNWTSQKEIKIVYTRAERSLVKQRNIGITTAQGDVLFFLDDDVIFEKNFISEIIEYYKKNWENSLGGVQGTIINNKNFSLLKNIRKIFLLDVNNGNGILQKSAFPSFLSESNKIQEVEIFNGCQMTFKRSAIGNERFLKEFEKYWWGDDIEFSYRISRKYKLYQLPHTKIIHNSSSPSYEGLRKIWKMSVINRKIIFDKYFKLKKINYIYYYWSTIGTLMVVLSQSIRNFSLQPLIGLIEGYYENIMNREKK